MKINVLSIEAEYKILVLAQRIPNTYPVREVTCFYTGNHQECACGLYKESEFNDDND